MVGGDWAFTTECRYFLYQNEGDTLHPREFSFSLDSVSLGLRPNDLLGQRDLPLADSVAPPLAEHDYRA